MPKKSLGVMTESMFYTIMAFHSGPRCGTEISDFVERLTDGRVQLGPGTLYTILSKFQEVGYLREIAVEGRKRTYELTREGQTAYRNEILRLNQCLKDAGRMETFAVQEEGNPHAGKNEKTGPAAVPAL
ncbi:MAG: helix-turn-helix transcriptional regulator [Oscillospiraceae bacterium]|nr:helix-turn-helix transcriptional regulator [Oscillospiraceae bacterium]